MIKNKLKESRIATIKNKMKDSRVAKIQNESKDAKIPMDAYDGLNSKLVKSGERTSCGTRRDH